MANAPFPCTEHLTSFAIWSCVCAETVLLAEQVVSSENSTSLFKLSSNIGSRDKITDAWLCIAACYALCGWCQGFLARYLCALGLLMLRHGVIWVTP